MTVEGDRLGAEGLFERSRASMALDRLFRRLDEGFGGALFFAADAGLGKTSILRFAEAYARSGRATARGHCNVARATGVLFGTGHAFRFVDQLFASVGADLGSGPDVAGGEANRSNRFLTALRFLDRCAAERPVVLLLDDLHWADVDSLSLIEFLCRQIPSRAVAIVGASRTWPPESSEMARRLELEGFAFVEELQSLSRQASVALLRSRLWGETAPEVLEKAADDCNGNPLLLEEVARSLMGGATAPSLEPFSTGRRAILLRRFAGVSDVTFRFLRTASVLGSEFVPRVVASMMDFEAPQVDGVLEEACGAGLVQIVHGIGRFVHPAFGDALYEGVQEPFRTKLHEAAFECLRKEGREPGQCAEHAMLAGLSDGVAIGMVRKAGNEALESGAWSLAMRFLGYAVMVTGERPPTYLIREHAEALTGAGFPDEALKSLHGLIETREIDDREKGRIKMALGQARIAAGQFAEPVTCFEEAAKLFAPHDRELAVDALLRGSSVARILVGPRLTMELAERAKDLAEGMSLDTHLQIDAAWAAGSLLLGRKDGLDELLRILDTVNSNPSLLEQFSESGWWPLVWCGSSCTFTERFDDAQRAFELGFPTVEKRGWPAAMGAYLVSHMELLFRTGRIEETRASLGELENLVKLAPLLRPFAMLSLGVLELEGGKFEAVEEISAQLEGMLGIFPQPPPILALWTLYLRGNLEAKRGRYDAACETFREIRAIAELGEINEPCVVPWWVSAMGVYRTTSRFDEIEGLVEWLLGTTAELPCLFPRAGIESGRAFLAEARGEIGKARECFERAVDLMGAVPMPIETAKILLWQGRFLRRQNDLVAARRTLAKAYELAKSSSSQKIASKAATDLRLAGGRVRQAKRSAGQLTQRQGEVAELASNGRTNSEIANELGISPKTVERHLENVYDTLGVRSRRDLMRRRFNSGVQIL